MTVRSANRGAAVMLVLTFAVIPVLQALPARALQLVADRGWPRTYATPSQGRVVIYEPQIASWANQKALVAFAAVAYQANGAAAGDKPALGTIKVEASTRVSLDQRLVNFADLRITESSFPTLATEQRHEAVAEIANAMPEEDRVIALDRVLAYVDKSAIIPKDVPGLNADPPAIFFSHTPAVLVHFDGDPIWSPIETKELTVAVNTNWDVFQHQPTKTYYLRYDQSWLKTTDLKGAWIAAGKLPASFAALPQEENFKEVNANVPGKALPASQVPTVIVSLAPAELILLRGAPSYLPVMRGSDLLWVRNTESDVFRLGRIGPVYYLVAGRWFSAPDFTGPWTFATPTLPADFTRIPLEHERSRVLASVPGTDEAIEAVLLAQIPQTARVQKSQVQAPPVGYQGAPAFEAIAGTFLHRAINTDKDVIQAGTNYYYCYQGIWFAGHAADGPWQVATAIPPEVYTIPASSPSHHVTYVVVEADADSNDDWVTVAYRPGYTGLLIGWGGAVWGSGWYYPPYAARGIYYPHFPTYGSSASYNPWSGSYAPTRQGSNIYGRWGSALVQRGDDWAQSNRVTNRATATTTRVTRTDDGGNIYAGRDGDVYRRENGSWLRHEHGEWENINRPTPQTHGEGGALPAAADTWPVDAGTLAQLDRDRSARTAGAERTRDYDSVRSSSVRAAASYRAAAGGRRR